MTRPTLWIVSAACLLASTVFLIEEYVVASCHTADEGVDPYVNSCTCPSSGSCHPNNSALTVTAYSNCATSCAVNVSA